MNTTETKLKLLKQEGVNGLITYIITHLHLNVLEQVPVEYGELVKLSREVTKVLGKQYKMKLRNDNK